MGLAPRWARLSVRVATAQYAPIRYRSIQTYGATQGGLLRPKEDEQKQKRKNKTSYQVMKPLLLVPSPQLPSDVLSPLFK